jgi:chorismate synthase
MQLELDRRRPGQSRITTPRKETDTCKILSGTHEGMTTGTPIHVFVPNTDQRGGVSIYSSSFLDTYFVINETETYGS